MDVNEALSSLHAINVSIDAYIKGLEFDGRKIDLSKVSEQLFHTRKALELIRVKK